MVENRQQGEGNSQKRAYSKPTVEVRQLAGVVNGIGSTGTDVGGLGFQDPD